MASKFTKFKNFFKHDKHDKHDKDKHCAKCGLRKKHGACKCKLTDQNVEDTEEGPSQSSTMKGENKEQGNSHDSSSNFNASVKSMDGLSTILESRHKSDDKSPMKFDKNFGDTKIETLKTPKIERKDIEKDSSTPDAPRVSFMQPEIFHCKVCGEKYTEKVLECGQCGSRMKDNSFNQSLDGNLSFNERKRLTTKKRKDTILKRTRLKGGGKSVKVKKQRQDDIENARKLLENIGKNCIKKNIHYSDYSFPSEESKSRSKEKWLALKDIKVPGDDGSDWLLYGDRTSAADVCQGEMLEDCWFSAAMACLGERKDLLEKIIISEKLNTHGVYVLRLCKDGAWKNVIVDDRFPCNDDGELMYNEVSGGHKILWPMLIQKAAAKLVGGYQHLNKGLIVEALAMLTGEPCDHMRLQKSVSKSDEEILPDKDTVWMQLLSSKNNRYLCGVATIPRDLHNDTFKDTGLVAEHAFAVLDVKEEEDYRLIKLTNPWAKSSVTGCLKNSVLNDSEVDCSVDSEKEIWITQEELKKYFISISFCEVHQDDTLFEIRMKGTFPPSFKDKWKYYLFTVPNDNTEMHFGLFQKNLRDKGTTMPKENFNDMMVIVLRNSPYSPDQEPLFSEVVSYSDRKARSLVTCKATLQHGSYTVACFAYHQLHTSEEQQSEDYMVDLNTDFTLVIHSSSVIYGEEVDHGRFPLLKHAPADALILLAKQLCIAAKDSGDEDLKKKRTMAQPNDEIDDVFTYTLNWWGQIHVIENNSDRSVIYIRDYSDSELLLNSRGKHRTEDVIPTGKCQVVNVMTAQMPDADWQVIPKKHLRIATTESQKLHKPEVSENFEGLHGTRPILILQPPQT